MNDFETLIFEKRGKIAGVTLNRPEVLNIHDMAMRDDLFEVLSAIREDNEVRVVLFKGAGERAFCAGADLKEFLTAPPPTAAREVRFDTDLWNLFTQMPQPLVAAVHGYCLGSGIEIALCCDLVIASDRCSIRPARSRAGDYTGGGWDPDRTAHGWDRTGPGDDADQPLDQGGGSTPDRAGEQGRFQGPAIYRSRGNSRSNRGP